MKLNSSYTLFSLFPFKRNETISNSSRKSWPNRPTNPKITVNFTKLLKIITSDSQPRHPLSRVERNQRNIRRALPDATIRSKTHSNNSRSKEPKASSHAVHRMVKRASLVSLEFANTRGLSMHNELHAYSSSRNTRVQWWCILSFRLLADHTSQRFATAIR